MNQGLLRKFLPHVIAVVVFLVIALFYCKPALDGEVVRQHDITSWKGAVQQSVEYGEKHDGVYPLWTNALFSGMPTFQIAYSANNYIPGVVTKVLTLGLPEPASMFFLACICFYFLALVLRVNPFVAIMGGLAFAYATYNPVIIWAGHVTKMMSIAYMPALLGSLLLIYDKRYWIGAALTAIFSSTLISQNHLQIAYYLFIVIGIMSIFFLVRWIRAKDYKHAGFAIGFALLAALVGVLTNAVNVLPTYEYQKETIRGGGSPLTDTTGKKKAVDGLDMNYAMSYSVGIAEPFVMMVPRLYGGSSDHEEFDPEKSKAVEAIRALPQETQQQLRVPGAYWGGIQDLNGNVYTSGPPYLGAIICFLAILGMFVVDAKYRWWLIAASAFAILMAWGSYLMGFNSLLFDYFPFYNKFRAPSMALVIPQLLFPILAVLAVQSYINAPDKKAVWPAFKKGLIATGGVFIVLFLLYFSFDYTSPRETEILREVSAANQQQAYQVYKSLFDGIKEDRQGIFMGDIWRSLGFIAVAALMLFLFIRNKVGMLATVITITALVFIDLILVDTKYLNKENYQEKSENEAVFAKSPIDNEILADKSYFRVANLSQSEENTTSYNFNSVSGYHAAKLRLYNDIIQHRLGLEESMLFQTIQSTNGASAVANTPTLNMLNAKYFIFKQGDRNTGEPVTVAKWINPNALGNAWFVDEVRFVDNADAEMAAIGTIDPGKVAVTQNTFKSIVTSQPQPDSTRKITLTKQDNDILNYTSESVGTQFAVFSEVYYAGGWKAFIDGKETPIAKVNYILRGIAVPAGKHAIEFRFEPSSYYKGKKITSVATIAMLLLLVAALLAEWRNRKKTTVIKAA